MERHKLGESLQTSTCTSEESTCGFQEFIGRTVELVIPEGCVKSEVSNSWGDSPITDHESLTWSLPTRDVGLVLSGAGSGNLPYN